VSIDRRQNDPEPTIHTWWDDDETWEIKVDHGRVVDGWVHGHRRLLQALNFELGELGNDAPELNVQRLASTTTRMTVDDRDNGDPYIYTYVAPRSGAVTSLTFRYTPADAFKRAATLVEVLRADEVHPRTMRSDHGGVSPIDCDEWIAGFGVDDMARGE
jgi:hypothetical protein